MRIRRTTLHLIATALIVAALALLVVGLPGRPALWWAGLGVLALALVLSFATRWAPADEEEPSGPADEPIVEREVPPP